MSTSRYSDSLSVDIGAQYITATPSYSRQHHSFYSELVSEGVLVPMRCLVEGLQQKEDSVNYISPNGMSAIVKHFLQQSGADLLLQHHVTGLFRRGVLWEVESKEGHRECFDAVLLTMPVPQILQLLGDLPQILPQQQRALLSQVQYSSRFAVALFFPKDLDLGLDFGLKYVSDNDCIRYLSVEHLKRETDLSDLGPSLVVHTSVSFGAKNLEKALSEIQPIILEELHKVLPSLPQPISIKTHKWRFSQVLSAVPGCPGHMTVLDQPLLLLGGDAFTHSNFDGCVESALSMLAALTERLRDSETVRLL